MNRASDYLTADQAIDQMRRGGYLMAQYSGAGTTWVVMPSGRRLHPSDIRKIVHRDDVVASGDALLPGSMPQTWRAR
jgi:hypothetical protein